MKKRKTRKEKQAYLDWKRERRKNTFTKTQKRVLGMLDEGRVIGCDICTETGVGNCHDVIRHLRSWHNVKINSDMEYSSKPEWEDVRQGIYSLVDSKKNLARVDRLLNK